MHEMSIAEGILQIVEEAAAKPDSGFERVKTIFVEVGELSSVEPEALLFCFEAVARGSRAEGAHLEIIQTLGYGRCLKCGETVAMPDLLAVCPLCGSHQLQATQGMEMRVQSLDVLDQQQETP